MLASFLGFLCCRANGAVTRPRQNYAGPHLSLRLWRMMGFTWRCCRFLFFGGFEFWRFFFVGWINFMGCVETRSKWASVGRRLEGERERKERFAWIYACLNQLPPLIQHLTFHCHLFNSTLYECHANPHTRLLEKDTSLCNILQVSVLFNRMESSNKFSCKD